MILFRRMNIILSEVYNMGWLIKSPEEKRKHLEQKISELTEKSEQDQKNAKAWREKYERDAEGIRKRGAGWEWREEVEKTKGFAEKLERRSAKTAQELADADVRLSNL